MAPINLQTATVPELKSIKEIGDSRAAAIVRLRKDTSLTIQNLVAATSLTARFFTRLIQEEIVQPLPLEEEGKEDKEEEKEDETQEPSTVFNSDVPASVPDQSSRSRTAAILSAEDDIDRHLSRLQESDEMNRLRQQVAHLEREKFQTQIEQERRLAEKERLLIQKDLEKETLLAEKEKQERLRRRQAEIFTEELEFRKRLSILRRSADYAKLERRKSIEKVKAWTCIFPDSGSAVTYKVEHLTSKAAKKDSEEQHMPAYNTSEKPSDPSNSRARDIRSRETAYMRESVDSSHRTREPPLPDVNDRLGPEDQPLRSYTLSGPDNTSGMIPRRSDVYDSANNQAASHDEYLDSEENRCGSVYGASSRQGRHHGSSGARLGMNRGDRTPTHRTHEGERQTKRVDHLDPTLEREPSHREQMDPTSTLQTDRRNATAARQLDCRECSNVRNQNKDRGSEDLRGRAYGVFTGRGSEQGRARVSQRREQHDSDQDEEDRDLVSKRHNPRDEEADTLQQAMEETKSSIHIKNVQHLSSSSSRSSTAESTSGDLNSTELK